MRYELLTEEKIHRVVEEIFKNRVSEDVPMVIWSGQLRIMYSPAGCFLIRGPQWEMIEYYCINTNLYNYDQFIKEADESFKAQLRSKFKV